MCVFDPAFACFPRPLVIGLASTLGNDHGSQMQGKLISLSFPRNETEDLMAMAPLWHSVINVLSKTSHFVLNVHRLDHFDICGQISHPSDFFIQIFVSGVSAARIGVMKPKMRIFIQIIIQFYT